MDKAQWDAVMDELMAHTRRMVEEARQTFVGPQIGITVPVGTVPNPLPGPMPLAVTDTATSPVGSAAFSPTSASIASAAPTGGVPDARQHPPSPVPSEHSPAQSPAPLSPKHSNATPAAASDPDSKPKPDRQPKAEDNQLPKTAATHSLDPSIASRRSSQSGRRGSSGEPAAAQPAPGPAQKARQGPPEAESPPGVVIDGPPPQNAVSGAPRERTDLKKGVTKEFGARAKLPLKIDKAAAASIKKVCVPVKSGVCVQKHEDARGEGPRVRQSLGELRAVATL